MLELMPLKAHLGHGLQLGHMLQAEGAQLWATGYRLQPIADGLYTMHWRLHLIHASPKTDHKQAEAAGFQAG